MAKSDRVARLLTLLRQLPQPVTATRLAEEAEVSQRTIYRDIDTLRASGVLIDGAPRYGYTLTEDPTMPPLIFDRLEVEALMLALGAAESFLPMDTALADALREARTKIIASMPERVQRQAQHAVGRAYRYPPKEQAPECLVTLREAAWEERAVDIAYRDRAGSDSVRVVPVLPITIASSRAVGMKTNACPFSLTWCPHNDNPALRRFLSLARVHAKAHAAPS